MAQTPTEQQARLIDFYTEDAADRLRFQHEFSVAGFKTLILINGGAVIALLTFAGNATDKIAATSLRWAFAGYIAGLTAVVLAYLFAYFGQAQIMLHSASAAYEAMGVEEPNQQLQDRRERRANVCIGLAISLCLFSLLGFVGGSIAAMCGLT